MEVAITTGQLPLGSRRASSQALRRRSPAFNLPEVRHIQQAGCSDLRRHACSTAHRASHGHHLCCAAGLKAFFTTPQLSTRDKIQNSLALGTSPIVRALIDPEGGMADIRKLDNVSFADWFRGHGGSQGSIDRMWDPIGAPARSPIT